jgi:hypothetical protein
LTAARDLTLLLRADAGHPPSADLAAVGDELAQQRGVLVVDVGDPSLSSGFTFFFGLRSAAGFGMLSV